MNRFFGMMPSSEVEISKKYRVSDGNVVIDAGKNGWTILYADGSSDYKDVVDTAENNFNNAYEVLKSNFSEITEIKKS